VGFAIEQLGYATAFGTLAAALFVGVVAFYGLDPKTATPAAARA
jgi:hypothetical protein